MSQHAAFQAMWAQYDHLVPHCKGGDNSAANMVVTCAPSNFARMDYLLEEVGLADPLSREPTTSDWGGLKHFRWLLTNIYIRILVSNLSVTKICIYFLVTRTPNMPDPTSETLQKVANRIAAAAPAGVWSKVDFLDIASPHGIEKALQRLTTQGTIRRVHRGLYDQPSTSTLTGAMVFPPRSAFIDAIARRDKLRVIVDGMTAANDLGLTTAVPARSTVHADTHPRTIEIEANLGDPKATAPVIYRLDFKRISAKTAFWAGHPAMRIIQALDWFKDDRANEPSLIDGIVRYLDRSPRRTEIMADLRENRTSVPSWMYTVIDMIIRKTEQQGDHAA